MTLMRERLGAFVAISIVAISTLLVLVMFKTLKVYNSMLLSLAFLPGFCMAGIGAYLVIREKDNVVGWIFLVGGLVPTFSIALFLEVLPAIPLKNIQMYGQNISLAEYNVPLSNDKIVFVKLKVGEEPKTYTILIHNSRNKFIVVKLVRKFASCNVLSGELVNISVEPKELWIAPGKTKSLKLVVYSNVNYTDTCTIRLIFEIN